MAHPRWQATTETQVCICSLEFMTDGTKLKSALLITYSASLMLHTYTLGLLQETNRNST